MTCDKVPTTAEIEQAKKDLGDLNTFTHSPNPTFTDSYGQEKSTVQGVRDTYGFRIADFTFTEGGTLTDLNQVVSNVPVDNYLYKYVGVDPAPLVIPASSDPVGDPDWQVFTVTTLQALAGLTDPSDLDNVFSREFSSVAEMIAYSNLKIGSRYQTQGTTWEMVSKSSPVVIQDFKPISDVCVNDFNADTDGFISACTIGSQYRRRVYQSADVSIAGVKGGAALVTPSGYFNYDSNGFTITDSTTYLDGEHGDLFLCDGCSPLTVKAKTVSQKAIDVGNFIKDVGWVVVKSINACSNIDIDLDTYGGLGGYIPHKPSGSDSSLKCKNIKARIKSQHTHYPYNAQFSGDNAEVILNADTCGRNYFLYGCEQVHLTCLSKNQQKTSIVTAYEGFGCKSIKVYDTDLESDNCQPAAGHVTFGYSDTTPAEHSNIDFILNTKNPNVSWGNTFVLQKLNGVSADSTARGHKLTGLSVTGILDCTASNTSPFASVGLMVPGDFIDNVDFSNIDANGASSTLQLQALVGNATFKNVVSSANFYVVTNSTSSTIFDNVRALNITASTANTDRHTYQNCVISDGTSQATGLNKSINETQIGSKRYTEKTANKVVYTQEGSNFKNQPLNNDIGIFNVNAAGGTIAFRMKYFLIDGANTTHGEKVVTVSLASNGVWGTPVVNDVFTPQVSGTAASLAFVFVNGSSAGANIAINVPNYTGANARATVKADFSANVPISVALL